MQPLLQWKSYKYYILCVCVFGALGIWHAMRMRHVVICDLSGCTVLYHLISRKARFKKN